LMVFLAKRRTTMAKKRHKPEEIIAKLRKVEAMTGRGASMAEAIRSIGGTEGCVLPVAASDLTWDKPILTEAARGGL
jgi:hypothetical protein